MSFVVGGGEKEKSDSRTTRGGMKGGEWKRVRTQSAGSN